jgi:hypothetical protein
MYFFKTVINVFVGTSVVSITVARYRFLVTTPDLRPRIARVLEHVCSWFGEDSGRLRVIVDGVMSRALLC